jgi:hypothetical protein
MWYYYTTSNRSNIFGSPLDVERAARVYAPLATAESTP